MKEKIIKWKSFQMPEETRSEYFDTTDRYLESAGKINVLNTISTT